MNNISNLNPQIKKQSFDESELVNQLFSADKEHLYSDMEGEAVILSLKNGKYYGVNSVGAYIWTTLQNPISFQDIQAGVMQEYSVDEETCRREVLVFLERMTEEGLVEVLDAKNS
ncbi:MAG: lasso peptide biosynthesis PqqD family chaperone [Acidobacteriota bacterium]